MADFCKQCSHELFGEDMRDDDLAGLVTREQFEQEGLVGIGICEGCAGGQFDHEGNCVGPCMESHEKEAIK